MIPVLYERDENQFVTNGLGALAEAITCVVTEERNGSFELKMTYPASGVMFHEIVNDRIILAKPAQGRETEPFRIYKIGKPINGIVTINAEHISYQLSYVPVSPFSVNNVPVSKVFEELVAHQEETHPFTFWTDNDRTSSFTMPNPMVIREALGGWEGSIIDMYRGEYEFNRYTVKLWKNRGANKGFEIRYGKNLTDLNQEENIGNVVTSIYPYYYYDDGETQTLVTLPEKILDSEYTDRYQYRRTVCHDFTERFQQTPTVEELRAVALQYLGYDYIGIPSVNITVKFAQLEQSGEFETMAMLEEVGLCDTVNIIFEQLDIRTTAKVTKAVYDVLMERFDSLTFGDVRTGLVKTFTETDKRLTTMIKNIVTIFPQIIGLKGMSLKEFTEKFVKETTERIIGVYGGNVIQRFTDDGLPYETLWLDTDDAKTAKNVIRINNAGIGLSTNGIDGPFRTAITAEGINANYILTGSMNAEHVVIGDIPITELFDDIQNQIDGTIETFTGKDTPTLTNYPANTWTETDYGVHAGDLFVGESGSPISGHWFRFQYNGSEYEWAALKDNDIQKAMADAAEAKDAVENSISEVDVQYYKSTSATSLIGGAWTSTSPVWEEGTYIWTRTKTVSNDGKSTHYSQPACITGNTGEKGDTGAKGDTGTGITSVTELYYCSNSSSVPAKPTAHVTTTGATQYNKWNLTCPTYTTTYKYYFTCSEILYTNGSYGWSNVVSNEGYNTANNVASAANSTANTANNTANTANGKADTAVSTANEADSKATDAKNKTDGLATGTTVINGGCIQTGKIVDAAGKYELNLSTGEVTMKSANITGGRILIDTKDDERDKIRLSMSKDGYNYFSEINSHEVYVQNGDNHYTTYIQGGGVYTTKTGDSSEARRRIFLVAGKDGEDSPSYLNLYSGNGKISSTLGRTLKLYDESGSLAVQIHRYLFASYNANGSRYFQIDNQGLGFYRDNGTELGANYAYLGTTGLGLRTDAGVYTVKIPRDGSGISFYDNSGRLTASYGPNDNHPEFYSDYNSDGPHDGAIPELNLTTSDNLSVYLTKLLSLKTGSKISVWLNGNSAIGQEVRSSLNPILGGDNYGQLVMEKVRDGFIWLTFRSYDNAHFAQATWSDVNNVGFRGWRAIY